MLEAVRELTSRSPRTLGHSRSRWTLALIQEELGEKAPETEAGTWQMLDRLGVSHTRGQGYALSPDKQFEAKRAFIDEVRERTIEGVRERTGTEEPGSEASDRLFYLDELTYELHPTVEGDWSPSGKQPTMEI